MFYRIHDKLGTAGLLVAVCALVLSLIGGAYAATSSKKGKGVTVTQVKKIAKQEAQKYANSNPGANGSNGKDGAEGKQGTEGKQGLNGDKGDPGDPWAAGGTLPVGSTETGTWSFGQLTAAALLYVDIPFFIPLEAPLAARIYNTEPNPDEDSGNVHYINKAGKEVVIDEGTFAPVELTPTECPGSAENPQAEPGHLCIYTAQSEGTWETASNFGSIGKAGAPTGPPFGFPQSGASTAGAILTVNVTSASGNGWGTYAVTG